MRAGQSTAPNRAQQFWDNYLKRLHQDGVKHPFDQWYVKRAEAFPRSAPRRLSERAPGDVEAFFRSFGRKPGLKDWQFGQIVDALPRVHFASGQVELSRRRHEQAAAGVQRAIAVNPN
jgi:hypothetical protein